VSGGPVPKPEDENAAEKLGADGGFGDEADADMGLAVLRGLVDDLDVELTSGGGVIRMGWPVVAPHWAAH
jgi:hypothetical protein